MARGVTAIPEGLIDAGWIKAGGDGVDQLPSEIVDREMHFGALLQIEADRSGRIEGVGPVLTQDVTLGVLFTGLEFDGCGEDALEFFPHRVRGGYHVSEGSAIHHAVDNRDGAVCRDGEGSGVQAVNGAVAAGDKIGVKARISGLMVADRIGGGVRIGILRRVDIPVHCLEGIGGM
ncbi:MAG: hypothetical protein BWY83_03021 [bacterium ADurb.Bin478]|nr:MAG: hypothetical protein BWY83_03021 [bacterium ADurb.Bin478]